MPLDIINWTDEFPASPLPLRPNPYTSLGEVLSPGQDFVLSKNGNLFFVSWDRMKKYQLWNYVPSLAYRFANKIIAWEFARFLDSQSIKRVGETHILNVASLRELPAPPRIKYAPEAEQQSDIRKWLTTYNGVLPR